MKFLDQILAAMATKDEAAIKAAVMKARDAEEEEEEKKRKEEAEAKDKARDTQIKAIQDSLPKLVADAVTECMKKMKDEEKEEEEKSKKAEDEAEEEELEEEAPQDKAKDARKAKDSALLEDSFNTVKMQAEIVAPGVQIPTFDRAADPKKTFRDCICGLRRKALTLGLGDSVTAGLITQVRGRAMDSAAVEAMSCAQTRALFNGVYTAKKNINNGVLTVPTATKTGDETLTPTQQFIAASKARWSSK